MRWGVACWRKESAADERFAAVAADVYGMGNPRSGAPSEQPVDPAWSRRALRRVGLRPDRLPGPEVMGRYLTPGGSQVPPGTESREIARYVEMARDMGLA